jgi:hypothetical protein
VLAHNPGSDGGILTVEWNPHADDITTQVRVTGPVVISDPPRAPAP